MWLNLLLKDLPSELIRKLPHDLGKRLKIHSKLKPDQTQSRLPIAEILGQMIAKSF